jgi:ABC-type multidrug transport system permease subunit
LFIIAALILFIFAVTQGSNDSWGKAIVIAPLVISIFIFLAFFTWEWWIDESKAALPPKMWFYDNFAVLFAVSLFPFFWWVSGKSR